MPDHLHDCGIEAYPIVGRAEDDAVVAFRQQHPIRLTQFQQDVLALAAQLPARRYVLNLCIDRYRFTVGLAAALCRQQISLMPPNDTPKAIEELASDYPDVFCLTDAAPPPLPSLAYPDDLARRGAPAELPAVPAEQPAVILFTSGSTGRARPTMKSWGTLVRSARAAGRRLGIDRLRGATLIGTVPHHHSYGLESTVLLGLQHGLAIDAQRPFYPGDIRARLAATPRPRILVTTPIHIRALLAEPEPVPPLDLILSATAPLAAPSAIEAEARFRAPVMEIYGCTEAGQLATRRTARERDWRCLDGIVLRQDERGHWASGPGVERPTLLQDVIEPSGPESFLLGGRIADLVDVAGKHTSLAHLNQQLLSIDGVRDGIFVMPAAEDDRVARPMAFVVAPGLQHDSVLRALRDRIDAAFLPRPLILVDALPRNALGKLPREALLRLAARSRWS